MFILCANKNKLTVRQKEMLTSGSVNTYEVLFETSHEWDSLARTAVFKAGSESYSVLLDKSNTCVIPWEVLVKPNVNLFAGIYGVQGETVVLPTVWANLGTIFEGATPGREGTKPSETGDSSNVIVTFNAPAERAALTSGDTLAVAMGKIAKYLDDLGQMAFKDGVTVDNMDVAIKDSLAKADTALQSYTETDPTIAAWAKEANKPTYTAAEIGAIPETMADKLPYVTGTEFMEFVRQSSQWTFLFVNADEWTESNGIYKYLVGEIEEENIFFPILLPFFGAESFYRARVAPSLEETINGTIVLCLYADRQPDENIAIFICKIHAPMEEAVNDQV